MESQELTLGHHIDSIIDDGHEVRNGIASAVRESISIANKTGESIAEIADKVIAEAVKAAARTIGEPGSATVAREVIDGLADGLQSTAHAVDLALAEARSNAEQFAAEDLGAAANDLRGIGDLLVDTVGRTAGDLGDGAAAGAKSLVEHAERTAAHLRPSLEAAASAAMADLGGIAKRSASAGLAATRHGIGTLLTEIGALLQSPAAPSE